MLPRISAGDVRVGTTDRTINSYIAWQRAISADQGRILRILELYVHPQGRGQRLGSGLLARAIDAARQRECRAVILVSNISDPGVLALVEPSGFVLHEDVLHLALQRE